ncbi:MAG TPA: MOSC domain-containing protein [Micropepsaceae bacterium]|nr:MOSC domain-containing protein [Micropepsaceae bacterium]
MTTAGKLLAIQRAAQLRGPLEAVTHVAVSAATGIEGDARGVKKDRQVTIVFSDGWKAACDELKTDLPWTLRRANLLVDGMSAPREWGARLRIGPVLLMVTEETKPCGVMEKQHAGLRAALAPDWRGGVCCKVLEGGVISTGDRVELVSD